MGDRQFAETLAGVQDGEEAAATSLWRAHHPQLLRFLRTRHTPHDVDDLASEVWLRAARNWDRFQGDERDFRAWLFSIARAVSIDSYRRAGRRREVLVGEIEPGLTDRLSGTETDALDSFGSHRAIAFLGMLPADQGDAIALRVIAGLDAERVAEIMGKRPGNVRVLQHRGLRRLAQLLEVEDARSWDVAL